MSRLKDFEALCKYVRECTGDDIVCGLCEYDAGTVGEEQIECPGFESNECFVLKESLRKQYEMYDQVIRCKDCKYHHEAHYEEDGEDPIIKHKCKLLKGYQFSENHYCGFAERKEE